MVQIQHQLVKISLILLISEICLVSAVKALGLGPLSMEITVERGKETAMSRNIQVSNSDPRPIHVVVSVTGSIAQFVTIEPKEFDLPAGPGLMSKEPRPYKYVKVTFNIPREVEKSVYRGEILFTQQPIEGGVLGTSVQLGVPVTLKIGSIAKAEFPMYLNGLVVLLIILMLTSIILWRFKP